MFQERVQHMQRPDSIRERKEAISAAMKKNVACGGSICKGSFRAFSVLKTRDLILWHTEAGVIMVRFSSSKYFITLATEWKIIQN